MTLDGNLLESLQKRRQRIQNLFGSGEPFSPIRKDFGGARHAAAFAHMRALKPGMVSLRNAQIAQHTSSNLANRMADFSAKVHLPASSAANSSAYTSFEPVFPVPQTAAPAETPAQPGELRAGMSIARMGTVPRPGQSFESFKAEAMASGLAKKPAAKAPTAPTPPRPQPGARVFSKVVEVNRSHTSESVEEEVTTNPEANRPVQNTEVPATKSDEPKLAPPAPPLTSPKASISEPTTRKPGLKPTTAPSVVQRQVEPVAPSAESQHQVEDAITQQPVKPLAKPAALPASAKTDREQAKPVAKASPAKPPLGSVSALPKAALARPAKEPSEAKPAKTLAQPARSVPQERPAQSLAIPKTSQNQATVQRQADSGTAPRLTIPKNEPQMPKANTPEGSKPTSVVAQAKPDLPAANQPTPAAPTAPEPSQPSPYLQEKLQRNITPKNLASQRQPTPIPSRPALPTQQLPSMSLRKPESQVPAQTGPLSQSIPAQTTPPVPQQASRQLSQSLPATAPIPAGAQKPFLLAPQPIAPQMPVRLPMPNVIQRLPDSKPAPSTPSVTPPPTNTAQTATPALPISTDHIPSTGITGQKPGNVVQRLWEEHSDMGGQQSGGQATPQEASASASQDVEKLAKKILPLVKHYLEIELERVGGRFGR